MTPRELHDACHEARLECPGIDPYDDDQRFLGHSDDFGSIPKKGLLAVVKFWREDDVLWGRGGYEAALPEEARAIFAGIDAAIDRAIQEFIRTL